MGITIENANKLLSVITSTITEDDDCFTIEDENLQVFKETLLTAIDTMRKYQKIEEIMYKVYTSEQADECLVQRLSEIREVVENGNDD